MQINNHKCGFVVLVGKPNTGKSTLLNALIGQKVSITGSKPQTTRQRILGIRTTEVGQAIFVDTPGIHTVHQNKKNTLNHALVKQAVLALHETPDVILMVVDALRFTKEDETVLSYLKSSKCPVFLIINKIDKLTQKEQLLPYLATVSQKFVFAEIIPVSARDKTNLEVLEKNIFTWLPKGVPLYREDEVTDKSVRFLAGELVREKLVRFLNRELPHTTAVEIEKFQETEQLCSIDALIWVEKPTQKLIVIGEKGNRLKEMGRRARLDMETLLGKKVYLRLWVKVKPNWVNNPNALRQLGYMD